MIRCFLTGQESHLKQTNKLILSVTLPELLYPVKILTESKTSEDLHLKETPLRQSTS